MPDKTARSPAARTLRSSTSTYVLGQPLPTGRVNLATLADIVRVKLNVVMSTTALRRLPISKQVVRRTLYLDVDEVLACLRAEFSEAPVVMTGVKQAGPETPPAPRSRTIRAARPGKRPRSSAPP